MDHRDISRLLVEVKASVEALKDKIDRLAGIEERLRKMDNRLTKVEQKVLVLVGGAGTLVGALIYKVVEMIFGR